MEINREERNKIFNELQETFNNANSIIEELMKSIIDYNESWMNNIAEEISDVEGESPEDRIKRIKGIYDRKEEIIGGKEIIRNKLKDGMMMIDNLNIVYQRINKIIYEDKEILSEQVDTIIAKVIETQEIRINKLIEENKRCTNRYKGELEDIRADCESKRVEKKYPPKHQIEQLEEWTEKRISNILFDSYNDNLKVDTSVFDQRIMNKEHIIIIIEDEEENKFGGYVNSNIDKIDKDYECIYDSKSFLFSLVSK
ncbi:trichohyalin, putative [Entamoeba histolytica]